MPAVRPPASARALLAVALVLLGLLAWLGHRLVADGERNSYSAGAIAPDYVDVTRGHTYSISVHDGVAAEADLGLDPSALSCTALTTGGARSSLGVTAESADSKATDQIATFVATATARLRVRCTGLPPVFIDDADDAGGDPSGLLLLLAIVGLGIGLPLGLSELRRRSEAGLLDRRR